MAYNNQSQYHGNIGGHGNFDQAYNQRDFSDKKSPHDTRQNLNKKRVEQNYSRARPRDKNYKDHARDESPDRQDRARPKGKQFEDHHRDPSPDRSLQQKQIQSTPAMNSHTDQQHRHYSKPYRQDRHNRGRQNDNKGFNQYADSSRNEYDDGQYRHSKYNRDQHGNYRDHDQYTYSNRSESNGRQYQNYKDEGSFDRRRGDSTWGEKSDFKLSKALSFILRHGAEKAGYKMMPGGFLYVEEILDRQRNLRDYTLEDVENVVKNNDKQRFYMEKEEGTGKLKIRANQGHTIEVKDLQLTKIESKDEVPMVVHGTYSDSWNKIKNTGLSRMGRNHIHFAVGEPGENGVISGMRKTCEIMIFINLEKALADGFQFYRSANNVILCEGNDNGIIPPTYFSSVIQRFPRKELLVDKDTIMPNVPIGGEGLIPATKSKKKKNRKKREDETPDIEKRTDSTDGQTKCKREKSEVDDNAIEDASSLFEEQMELEASTRKNENCDLEEGLLENCDDDEEQDIFHDANDVKIESDVDLIKIQDIDSCISSVDFLKTLQVVAVWFVASQESIHKIAVITEDKSYFFDVDGHTELMKEGQLADFFNYGDGPFKVFSGLNSQVCALLFSAYDVILDGTKLFDLKIACDIMNRQGIGSIDELKHTGYNPDLIPESDDGSISDVCQLYLKAYPYLSMVMKEYKDFKRELFELVNHDINKSDMKVLKEKRKKQSKSLKDKGQNQSESSKQKKGKKKHQ